MTERQYHRSVGADVFGSSREVPAPTAYPRSKQRPRCTGLPHPRAWRLQVFATSWRFHWPRACWPCFRPDPLLGFPLQSFLPLVQPYAVSSASTLLSLVHTVCRQRRLERDRGPAWVRQAAESRLTEQPSPSGFCSTRESATSAGGLDRRRHVALLGFRPFRALPFTRTVQPSPHLPSRG
jgi:hypothetical protein